MNPATLLLALLLFSLESFGKDSEYTFNSNRWQENYQNLAKQTHRTAYESLKYLPLLPNRDDIYLSLGGNFRERLNSYNNDLFGLFDHAEGTQLLQYTRIFKQLSILGRLYKWAATCQIMAA